ncbi:hypothetical protein BH09SUM1_BH09SUM1_07610 [soil metagenome]
MASVARAAAAAPPASPRPAASSVPVDALSWLGSAFLFVMGALVPLFVIPYGWFPHFDTIAPEAFVAKGLLLLGLGGAALAVAAILLFTDQWRRLTGPAMLPALALAAWVAWGTLSVFIHPNGVYTFSLWSQTVIGALAAIAGALIIRRPSQVRAILWGVMCAAVIVAVIGILGTRGWRGFNMWVFNMDPGLTLERADLARLDVGGKGGTRSGPAMSTLANPEYSGTYCAIIASLWAVVLLDWPRGKRNPWLLRGLALIAIPILLLEMAVSSSRQAWLAIAIAAAFRLFLELRIRKLFLAAGFCTFLFFLSFFGVAYGMAFFVIFSLGILAYSAMKGVLFTTLRRADRFNLTMILGAPLLVALMIVAYSIPGPWNPSGVRVFQRFQTLLSKNDSSFQERAMFFMIASDIVWKEPLFGAGPGRFRNKFTLVLGELDHNDESGVMRTTHTRLGNKIDNWTHNDYLQTAAETGLVGLALFLSAMIFLFARLSAIIDRVADPRRPLALAVIVCLAAFFCVMLSSFPLFEPSRAAVFWTLVACGFGLIAQDQNGSDGSVRTG